MEKAVGSMRFINENPVVALLPWGNLIEDFLDTLGVSLESFCTTQTGGWLFGYISALSSAGIRTRLICVSGGVKKLTRFTHTPTGAQVSVLPASPSYHRLRRFITREEERKGSRGRAWRLLRSGAGEILPYLATPVGALLSELRQGGCQAVICQEYEYPRFDVCVLAGWLLKIPVFGCYQGGNSHSGPLENFIRPFAMKWSKGFIIGTRTERERVSGSYRVPSSKIAAVFNPLDIDSWHALDREERRRQIGVREGTNVVVWHGRVDVRRKGLDTLLDAWKLIEDRIGGPEAPRLLLVGTGDDVDLLRAGIADRGLRGVIWRNQYLLDHDQIRGYLAAADLYVLASRHEGFAVAPLEAMACGLPIVTTDVSGARDLLDDGEFSGGIIVPPSDPNRLADAVVRLLHDPPFRRMLGIRARLRVEHGFSWEIVGRQLRAFMLRDVGGKVDHRSSETTPRLASQEIQSPITN
jgi:glycosyltransferase involved in cell wall biosynthesis